MQKSLFMVLALSLPLVPSSALASSAGFTAKYHISVNGSHLGLLMLHATENAYEARYYGPALTHQKLPFFSKLKRAQLSTGLVLNTLSFENRSYQFYHTGDGNGPLPPLVAQRLKGNKRNRSVIVDEEGLPKYIFDQMPSGSLEHLLLQITSGKLQPREPFMLFEGGSIIRVYLISEGETNLTFRGRPCRAESLACIRTDTAGGKDTPLFQIWLSQNRVPITVRSYASNWSLELNGYGNGSANSRVQVAVNPYLAKNGESQWRNILREIDPTASNAATQLTAATFQVGEPALQADGDYGLPVSLTTQAIKPNPKTLAKIHIRQTLAKTYSRFCQKAIREAHFVAQDGDVYFGATLQDITNQLAKADSSSALFSDEPQIRYEGHFKITSRIWVIKDHAFLAAVKKSHPKCDPVFQPVKKGEWGDYELKCGRKKLDLKKAVATYLQSQSNGKETGTWTIDKIKIQPTVYNQEELQVQISVQHQEPVAANSLRKTAAFLLANRLCGEPNIAAKLAKKLMGRLTPFNGGYALKMEKGDLNGEARAFYEKRTANKIAALLKPIANFQLQNIDLLYTKSTFQVKAVGSLTINRAAADAAIAAQIRAAYPDLVLMGASTRFEKQPGHWSFQYLEGIENVATECDNTN